MTCMESELTSCSGDPKNLLRALIGPLMPHGVDVAACPAMAGGENKLKVGYELKYKQNSDCDHLESIFFNVFQPDQSAMCYH